MSSGKLWWILGGLVAGGVTLAASSGSDDAPDDGDDGSEPEAPTEDDGAPDVPRPTPHMPEPTSTSPGLPPNYRVMADATALQGAQLLDAVEGNTSQPSTVFVGADPAWTGRGETFEALRRLAIERPGVQVRVFSFELTRSLVGQPPAEPFMSHLAVAADSTGKPGPVRTGAKRSDAPLSRDTLALLFDLAEGEVLEEPAELEPSALPVNAMVRQVRRPGDPPSRVHTVLVYPQDETGLQWDWQVWKGQRIGEPIGQGTAPTSVRAFEDAAHFVQWYQPAPRGGLGLG